ncbi:squalene--hopene cyclase [Niallia sp. 01092]|uniref:squalene--hopene cyclase n=1 Tax=unclassified Niallia TaxID=2837522 RepID=UPI003FD3C24B
MLMKKIEKEIGKRINELTELQHIDGSWRFRFQGSLITDAFFIITCRALDFTDEEKNIQLLVKSLKASQHDKGFWQAYNDEHNGNLSATVIAYTALLYSGYVDKNDEKMQNAKTFILANRGLAKTHFMIRWMLSVNGMYPWSNMIYIPMTFLLLPTYQPINFFQFSSYARIHFIPMLIASNKKFAVLSKHTPNMDDLFDRNIPLYPSYSELNDTRSPLSPIWKEIKKIGKLPIYMHNLGYMYAEKYILDRLEEDGTLYSYATATFFMIYGLLALGYKKDSIVIQKAMKGLSSLIHKKGKYIHLENSSSTVWDTGLISYSLQQAGLSIDTPAIQRSISYLLKKQHSKKGDWAIHNPRIKPGGWGFSNINTNNPDNDDTAVVLRALTKIATVDNRSYQAYQRGLTFLLSMQNRDGGWGAFEKNTNWELLQHIPIENARDAAVDPSTADLTGRVLEYLGNFAGLNKSHTPIQTSINWLLDHQQKNGSWYGRWGVCYIYGTWAAITGLIAVGVQKTDPSIVRAVKWLKRIQRQDGGWGESCQSCEKMYYVPLPFSTESQTAWAIDALIAAGEAKSETVSKGIPFLLQEVKNSNSVDYPTGIGLPRQFYIHYQSYNKIFPLLALAHYAKEFRK